MEKNNAKKMIFAALFAALTAAVAQFKIPLGFTPVPITLQTLMVLLSGALLGPYYGGAAMLLYIGVGALGLPVFAGGSSGIGVLLGPTGGYLFSYFIAAFATGKMLEMKKKKRVADYAIAMIPATLIIYLMGGLQGMLVTGLTLKAIVTGWVLPFIIGDTIKLVLAAFIAKSANMQGYLK